MIDLKLLIENLLQEVDEKEDDKPSPEKIINKIKLLADKNGFSLEAKSNNMLVVKAEDRQHALEVFRKNLEPLGFFYDAFGGSSSMGRMGLPAKLFGSNKTLYIIFKPLNPSKGERGAVAGQQLEKQIADSLTQKLSGTDIEVKTAGFAHGSDLVLQKDDQSILSIEVKTVLGADFGQFKIGYNVSEHRWAPIETENFLKNKELFMDIFNTNVAEFMNKNAQFPEGIPTEVLMMHDNMIEGLNPSMKTGEIKNILQKAWFKDRTDAFSFFDFKKLAEYYGKKGDSFIQINGYGLYGLTEEKAKLLKVPYFGSSGLKGLIRIRIKPRTGMNGHHSFTVAIKISGNIDKSPIDLSTEEGQTKFAETVKSLIQPQQVKEKINGEFDYKDGDSPPTNPHQENQFDKVYQSIVAYMAGQGRPIY